MFLMTIVYMLSTTKSIEVRVYKEEHKEYGS